VWRAGKEEKAEDYLMVMQDTLCTGRVTNEKNDSKYYLIYEIKDRPSMVMLSRYTKK
jgi:hypothetical protein